MESSEGLGRRQLRRLHSTAVVTRAEDQISAPQIIILFLGLYGGAGGKEDPVSDGSLSLLVAPGLCHSPAALVPGLKAS